MLIILIPFILFVVLFILIRKGILKNLASKITSFIIALGILLVTVIYLNVTLTNSKDIFDTALKYYSQETVTMARNLYETKRAVTFDSNTLDFELNINNKWYSLSELQYKEVRDRVFIKVDNKEYEITDKELKDFLREVQ